MPHMDLTYEGILADIREKNYVEVPFPMSQEDVRLAAQRFFNFLTLPQAVKDRFKVIVDSSDRGSNAGYARKEKAKGDGDNKEYFNYRKMTREVLARQLQAGINDPRVDEFLQSADRVLTEAVATLQRIIRPIEERHPGIYARMFTEDPARLLALRFVKYDTAGQGDFLARAHYDRGSCALAIGESAPGLRVGRDEGTLREVIRHGNTAVFMPALTFPHNVGCADFTPAWHDVVQRSDRTYSADAARWAIVLFSDVKKDRSISLEESHTPLRY